MTKFTAGKFMVEVMDPYPCWISVHGSELNGEQHVFPFHHNEITDLQFVLERARQEAMRKLGKDANEVL